jgi:hypothetical protein
VAEAVSRLICILEEPGSIIFREVGKLTETLSLYRWSIVTKIFRGFSQFFQANSEMVYQLGQDNFLSHPIPVIH